MSGLPNPEPQAVLATLAMLILGVLAITMLFVAVPGGNHDFLVFILGAISGAITVGSANKISTPTQPKDAQQPPAPPVAPPEGQ